jgi:hypothetical protein
MTNPTGINATQTKLLLRAAQSVPRQDGGEQSRVQVLGTIEDGYVPSQVDEQLWDCTLIMRPNSRQALVRGMGTECGPGPAMEMPARLHFRPTTRNDGTKTLMVSGVALGDFRTYPSNGKQDYGLDEMVTGEVEIRPRQRWDAKEAFKGYRVDEVLTSYQFASPQEHLPAAK